MSTSKTSAGGSPATRTALLEAGVALLLGPDPRDFSMGAVAKRAGVSRQAAYLHFPSRAALLLGVADHANTVGGFSRRAARIASAPDAAAALDAFVSTVVWQATHLGAALRAVRRLVEHDPELAASWSRRAGRREAAREVADRLAEEGTLAPHLTARAAASLLMALSAPEVCEQLLSDGWSQKRTTRELRRIASAALTRQ